MWVEVESGLWRLPRPWWRRRWSWQAWCVTADGQVWSQRGQAWTRHAAKMAQLAAWAELALQMIRIQQATVVDGQPTQAGGG